MTNGKVLVLGSGMVAPPLVAYLLDRGLAVTIATPMVERARELVAGHPQGQVVDWTTDQEQELKDLATQHDVVVSLLPAPFHPQVGRTCVDVRRHLVSTSYVTPEMRALDGPAQEADVLLLNEIGVDPGIDHMSIMAVVEEIGRRGGQLTGLQSVCGGLPAPEANTNPLGYKFSWSPAGVLVAITAPVLFREKGQRVDLPPGGLFQCVRPVNVPPVGELEYYPNRDSLQYLDLYGLNQVETMFRGTFRYPGWGHLGEVLWKLGLLDRTVRTGLSGRSWADVMAELADTTAGPDLRRHVAERASLAADDPALDQMEWLGLFSQSALGDEGTLLDCLAGRLMTKMAFEPGERDMLLMRHEFEASFPGGATEKLTSTMLAFGEPDGDSAMARTVSFPAAIAVRLIVEGKVSLRGVQVPVVPELYRPVLAELEDLGISFIEESSK
jgi:saccharopine dehydrogenase-like NADP-dependent oxidoreductase